MVFRPRHESAEGWQWFVINLDYLLAKQAGEGFTCAVDVWDGDAGCFCGLGGLLWFWFVVKLSDKLSDKVLHVSVADTWLVRSRLPWRLT